MSILDELANTPITRDWLVNHGWLIGLGAEANMLTDWFTFELIYFREYYQLPHKNHIRLTYCLTSNTIYLFNTRYHIETVEDLKFVMHQISKRENITIVNIDHF